MQPRYVNLTTASTGAWQVPNWQTTPQEISWQVISAGSSWIIQVTLEDPSGTYPNPLSSSPTGFTLTNLASNSIINVPSSLKPIAGYRFAVNALSTLGGATNVQFITMQSGIG